MSDFAMLSAADNVNMQAGGTSFFDDTANLLTKGTASAVLSGLYSIANTGIDFKNKVFGGDTENLSVENTLNKIDSSWADYYTEHKEGADLAGFIGGSLIPGSLAIKGLKLAQQGKGVGAFSRVLGYTSQRQSYYLDAALKDLATEGGTVFSRINSNKLAAMAWGTADQTLQMAAFETATALTMKSSPLLENKDWKEIISDMPMNAVFGGAIGGVFASAGIGKILKESGKLVSKELRNVDVIANADSLSMIRGEKAFTAINAVMDIPEAAVNSSVDISHLLKDFPSVRPSLDITTLVNKTRDKTLREAADKVEGILTHFTDDPSVGAALARPLLEIFKDGISIGKDKDIIRQRLGEKLFGLSAVESIAGAPARLDGEIKFFSRNGFVDKFEEGKTVGYRVVGDENTATKFVLEPAGITLQDAFTLGYDIVENPLRKSVHINPESKIYTRISDQAVNQKAMFFNAQTGNFVDEVIPSVADIATNDARGQLIFNDKFVSSGDRKFSFSVNSLNQDADTVEVTARHLWASMLNKISGTIEAGDFSILDAIRAKSSIIDPSTVITRMDGSTVLYKDISNFDDFVFKEKLAFMHARLDKGTIDPRELAYRINASPSFIEKTVANKFAPTQDLFSETEAWSLDLQKAYAKRDNIITYYDISKIADQPTFVDGMTAYASRVKEAVQKTKDASALVMTSKWFDQYPELGENFVKGHDGQTVGSTFLAASNADYTDNFRRSVQYIGQLTEKQASEAADAALGEIQGSMIKVLKDPKASMELTALVTKLRTNPELDGAGNKIFNYALYESSGKTYLVDHASWEKTIKRGKPPEFVYTKELSPEVGEFLTRFQAQHAARVDKQNVLKTAQGLENTYNPDILYIPPVDTTRVPYFAFVRKKEGTIFNDSQVGMITARNEAELMQKVQAVESDPSLVAIYKKGTEEFKKAKGDYDFNRAMNDRSIDSSLESKKLLGDYLPNFSPEATIEDFVRYTQNAETKLVRDAVSVRYAQEIAQLKDLSARYTQNATSSFDGSIVSKFVKSKISDPYGDAIKLMHGISKQSEFTLWHDANEFIDALGSRAWNTFTNATQRALKKEITWEEANKTLESFGIGNRFTDEATFIAAQSAPDRNILKTAIQKANAIIVNGMLKLDAANSLINVLSTPILLSSEVSALRNSLKNDPELLALLQDKLSTTVPDTGFKMPSATKLMFAAVKNYFSKESPELLTRYKNIGVDVSITEQFKNMMDSLSLTPKMVPSKYAETVDSLLEKGASLSGNKQAESFTRFVTADVMRMITEDAVAAGKMSVQEQNSFISIFVNRVQGNYNAAQRPILFQGTLGSAVGLFQTYQFNMLQQLYRHIENRDMKTLAVLGGMQTALFGLNGLPFFQAINTHIIGNAAINDGHEDIYSYAVKAAGKDMGNWLLYGSASALPLFNDKAPALWTRGDLNPRSLTVIPTTLTDVPAVAVGANIAKMVTRFAGNVSSGAPPVDAMLFALEHNGLSRPLSGLASVVKGNATDSAGNLISASSDIASMATVARLIGAKPMDDSIALNATYRLSVYQAADKERLDKLGSVIKDKLRNNQALTSEDIYDAQAQYAAAGGRIENFYAAIHRWNKAANTSVANAILQHSNTMKGKRLNEIMGGDPLPDYAVSPVQ